MIEKEWGGIEEITLTYIVVRLWDLHCEVREKLGDFIAQSYPEYLPRICFDSRKKADV